MLRNPKQEAQDFIDANLSEPTGLTAYVLEPSPPAQNKAPLFADLPLEIKNPETALTPTTKGSYQYSDFPELKDFAAKRWLGHFEPLPQLPNEWIAKLEDIHRLAFGVVSEARKLNNTKFGLRWVMGGFGTPFYGDDVQIRVVDAMIVLQDSTEVKTSPITTLRAAGDFLGLAPSETQREHDSPELGDLDKELIVDKQCNDFLGSWFGLTTSCFEELRLRGEDPAPIQIWPGHFDVATELSVNETKNTLGASPGDENHSEPYLYMSPHIEIDKSKSFWNAKTFPGALLSFSDLVSKNKSGQEQYLAVLDFFQTGLDLVKSQN